MLDQRLEHDYLWNILVYISLPACAHVLWAVYDPARLCTTHTVTSLLGTCLSVSRGPGWRSVARVRVVAVFLCKHRQGI